MFRPLPTNVSRDRPLKFDNSGVVPICEIIDSALFCNHRQDARYITCKHHATLGLASTDTHVTPSADRTDHRTEVSRSAGPGYKRQPHDAYSDAMPFAPFQREVFCLDLAETVGITGLAWCLLGNRLSTLLPVHGHRTHQYKCLRQALLPLKSGKKVCGTLRINPEA